MSQILNGVLLPPILVFMLVLANRESLMGRFHERPRLQRGRAWGTVAALTVLTVLGIRCLVDGEPLRRRSGAAG